MWVEIPFLSLSPASSAASLFYPNSRIFLKSFSLLLLSLRSPKQATSKTQSLWSISSDCFLQRLPPGAFLSLQWWGGSPHFWRWMGWQPPCESLPWEGWSAPASIRREPSQWFGLSFPSGMRGDGGTFLSTSCVVVNMSYEGWVLAPCMSLLLLFLLFLLAKNCNTLVSYHSFAENSFSKEILAVASKSGTIPKLARGFLAVQAGHLEAQRCRWLLYLCSAWDWLHLWCRWWLHSSKG